MKQRIYGWLMMVLLVASACATDAVFDESEVVWPTKIDNWTLVDQFPFLKKVEGTRTTVNVGFAQTKAYMEMNDENLFAKVLWKAGDRFLMLGADDKFAVFSTATDGERVAFTTTNVTPVAPKHCLYTPTGNVQFYADESGYYFGFDVPNAQEAVAGKVNDAYLRSYARTDNDTDFYFRSAIALVRFRMKGSIVSSVTSVRLEGASQLSGNFIIKPTPEGIPAVTLSVDFEYPQSYPYIDLSGSFKEGAYYYFAVIPGTQNGFSLKFTDGTRSTTLISGKNITFARGEITDIGEIRLGDAFSDPVAQDMSTIKFISATAGAPKPVSMAVIPDGFTASEMSRYEMLAKAAVNTLFSVEPYKSYKEYFNVFIMKAASNESGARIADGTYAEQNRDCYFQSSWSTKDWGSTMTANWTIIKDFVSINCPDIISGVHTINDVPILMIINDTRYGGICHTSSEGFACCMVPYINGGHRLYWPYPDNEAISDKDPSLGYAATSDDRRGEVGYSYGNWLNLAVHEFGGHCFGRLADEYWYTDDKGEVSFISEHRWDDDTEKGVPYALNISATYDNPGYDPSVNGSSIKEGWQHLLDKRSDLIANKSGLYSRIGVFQGGGVSLLHRWRSERTSCMVDNRFYFSTFQRELIVKRIMTLAGASFDEDSFWAKDVMMDPVRDIDRDLLMDAEDDVPPRPMHMTPPPVYHSDW